MLGVSVATPAFGSVKRTRRHRALKGSRPREPGRIIEPRGPREASTSPTRPSPISKSRQNRLMIAFYLLDTRTLAPLSALASPSFSRVL